MITEEAGIEFNKLIKRGVTPSEASEITGYKPTKGEKETFKNFKKKTKLIRQYLNVPIEEKEVAKVKAKENGKTLIWDREAINPVTLHKGCWYVETFPATRWDPSSMKKWLIK